MLSTLKLSIVKVKFVNTFSQFRPPKYCLFALTQPTATSEPTQNIFHYIEIVFGLEIYIFGSENIPERVHRE